MNAGVLLAFSIIASLAVSCSNNGRKEHLKMLLRDRIGDSIVFPSSLVKSGSDSSILEIDNFSNCNYKLVVFTDGDCGKCITELYEWKDYLEDNKELFKDVRKIFVINSNNFPRFEYTIEKAAIYLPYFYDSTNRFTECNMLDEEFLHTLLLDNNDKILIVGSPINNNAMKEIYLNLLSKAVRL